MTLKGKFEQSHSIVKIIQWLGCILLLTIPSLACAAFFRQPFSVSSLKWIQFVQTVTVFLLPPMVMAYLWSSKPTEFLQLRTTSIKNLFYVFLIILAAVPAINLLADLNQQLKLPAFLEPLENWMKQQEETAAQLTEQFLNVKTLAGLLINLLLMALLPALAEEFTFRGTLQRLFAHKDTSNAPHLAIWCSAIIFSAIHMQFYGFLPRMLMGALFGYMLAWTGSLWVPILMHFTNNALAVLLYFTSNRFAWDTEQLDAIGTGDTLWLGIVSMVITIVGIYAFRRSTTIKSASSRMSKGN